MTQSIATSAIAYDRPGGSHSTIETPQPIDIAQLRIQTMGDRDLERDVLLLFSQQASLIRTQLTTANPQERVRLAHGFKGSALAIGATAAGHCAANIMEHPLDEAEIARLDHLIVEVQDFIARMTR